jgi:hypothetical protein
MATSAGGLKGKTVSAGSLKRTKGEEPEGSPTKRLRNFAYCTHNLSPRKTNITGAAQTVIYANERLSAPINISQCLNFLVEGGPVHVSFHLTATHAELLQITSCASTS